MDWFLRNVLLLDPGTTNEQLVGEGVDPNLGVVDEPDEDITKLLVTFPCSIEIGGVRKDFKVRCAKTPIEAIVLCRTNGEQVRSLAISTLSAVNRLTERRLGMVFAKVGADEEEVASKVEAQFEFRTATSCRQFAQALQKLFGVEVLDPLKNAKRKWELDSGDVAKVEVGLESTVSIIGAGTFDETFRVAFTAKGTELKSDSQNRLFPFTMVTWYLTEQIGGVNRSFNTQNQLNKNDKTFPLTSLMSGRFVQADVQIDRAALVHKKDKAHFKVIKGPILPSSDLTLSLLNIWSVNATTWPINMNGAEAALAIPYLFQVPADLVEMAATWKSQISTRLIVSSVGLRLLLPQHEFQGFRLRWAECLASLPEPIHEETGQVHQVLTRHLAYSTSFSFLNPDGSDWITMNIQFMGQKERDAFWHTAMYFLLNKADEQGGFYQWEIDRQQGKTSDLQKRFRDTWLSLDWRSLSSLVEIPRMYSEAEREDPTREAKIAKVKSRKKSKKVRDKRTILQQANEIESEEASEDEELVYVTEPQESKAVARKRSWDSSSGSALSEDDPTLRR